MKNYLILSALLAFVPAAAQTSLGDYRQAVTEYSWELKVAASKSDAASQTMGQARTGYLPRLSLDGSFTATVHHYDGVERWNFSVLPQLVQTVYGGGAVRAAYKQAELGYDIALCDEEFTQLDVRYAAEYTYWNLSAMELYAASMRQYVNIIRSLKEVVDRRFAEGYIAKGDVLMIDARLSEAQYGLVSAEQNYTVALHNFNILRGTDPDLAVELAQGIRDSLPQPVRVLPDEVLGRRPDYMAARLRSEQADAGIRAARAPFNPQVSVGIGGSWQPYFPNRTGATTVDGSAFVKLTLPIFHWGERRRATGAARAVQRQSEWNTALLHDNIVRDEMNGWTALVNSRAQVDATEQSLRIAGENLLRRGALYDPRCVAGAAELDTAIHQCDQGSLQLCRGGIGLPAHHGAVSGGRQALPGRPSRRGCLFRLRKPHGRDRLFGTPSPVSCLWGYKKTGIIDNPRFCISCPSRQAFTASVLTTAISCDTGATLRSICIMPQYFSCASVTARPTLAWSSSVSHSML